MIKDNRGVINEIHIMNCLFEMTSIRMSQVRARKNKSGSGGLPPSLFEHLEGISENAANAIVKHDVGYFARKYHYKQYVRTSLTKRSEKFWMGPFHTPAVTTTGNGNIKAYGALQQALRSSQYAFSRIDTDEDSD